VSAPILDIVVDGPAQAGRLDLAGAISNLKMSESPSATPPGLRIPNKRLNAENMKKKALESDLTDHTTDKLRAKFEHVERKLEDSTRRFPPLGHAAMLLYGKALDKLINTELNEEDKLEWISLLRMHERSVEHHACLQLVGQDDQPLMDKIMELMKMRLYARYGDMFAQICNRDKNLCRKNGNSWMARFDKKNSGHKLLRIWKRGG
jgi:hypothetical protein